MGESVSILQFTTLGDVIKKYREQANLSISELARQAGVHKAVISKVESGDTKRPEIKTIMPIAKHLGIPTAEIIEHYIEIDGRPEVLFELVNEAIQLSNIPLISKVALRFLQSSYEDSYILMDRLYKFVGSQPDQSFQLPLYEVIIKYARERGMQRYLAKGLLQKYLIERQDLKLLEESFIIGGETLHYVDFLSLEEKMTLYFRMTLHAHNIKKYLKCIELCEAGLSLKTGDTELKARAYYAMINSYYFLGNLDVAEKHLDVFEKFDYDFVSDSTKINRAAIKTRKKEFDLAIPMLKNYLRELHKDNRIHVVNDLLEIYLEIGDIEAITNILTTETELLPSNPQTPYKHFSVGIYYELKGTYQTRAGYINEGMESYIKSILAYAEINAFEEINKCMNDILAYFLKHSIPMDLQYVEMLNGVYNIIRKKCK